MRRQRFGRLPAVAGVVCASLMTPSVSPAQQSLTQDQRIVHLLSRLGYGARAGDIERVRALGIEVYIDEQLHPEKINDPVADARLARYGIVGMTFDQLWEYDRPAAAVATRRREPAIRKAYLAAQAAKRMPMAGEADSAAGPRRTTRNAVVSPRVTRMDRPRTNEILDTRFLRAVYSERQLLEVMVDFWFNHFNISVGDHYMLADWTERVIRPHALGKFEDLLVATARHPAMLVYLDNWLSAAPAEVIRGRLEKWQPLDGENKALALRRRMPFFQQTKGLNENYARELMELHTLGVEGGYTQKDVQEVARAFTGWTLTGPREDGTFVFEPLIHEQGDKLVLGQTVRSGGMDEGKQILRLLAHHPSTATFVARKLVRRFVADDPPPAVVDAAARTFRETSGDIPAVLRAIFASPEFYAPQYYEAKIKKPLEIVISALRTVNADIDFSLEAAVAAIDRAMTQMGEPLTRHPAPDGFPDVGPAWISTNTLYQRLDFAVALTSGQLPGIRGDPEAAARLFREMGYPEPTAEQVSQAQGLVARRASRASGVGAGMMSAEQMVTDQSQQNEMYRGTGAAARSPTVADRAAVATAVHLGSPRFQKR